MRSVYLHHFCLITLAGTDGPSTIFNSMSSWLTTSCITPWRGLCPTRRSLVSSRLSRGRPSPSMARGLLHLGTRDLPHGRTRGLRCTHRKAHTTLGLTITPDEEAPRDRSRRAQLRPKA